MYANLRALFIDSDNEACEALAEVLSPHFYFIEKRFVHSFHDGLQILLSEKIDVCFAASALGAGRAKVFLIDAAKIEENKHCVFVYVQNPVPKNFDRAACALAAGGFATAITRACNAGDVEELSCVVKGLELSAFEAEVKQKLVDVNEAVEVMLRELDGVAMDRKRRVETDLNCIAPGFIAMLTEFHEQILEKYYTHLVERLTKAAPPPEGFCKLEVPAEVLEKKLPALHEDGYAGHSRRTWKKLAKRFGIDKNQPQVKKEKPAPE